MKLVRDWRERSIGPFGEQRRRAEQKIADLRQTIYDLEFIVDQIVRSEAWKKLLKNRRDLRRQKLALRVQKAGN